MIFEPRIATPPSTNAPRQDPDQVPFNPFHTINVDDRTSNLNEKKTDVRSLRGMVETLAPCRQHGSNLLGVASALPPVRWQRPAVAPLSAPQTRAQFAAACALVPYFFKNKPEP
jgi:hypothetical protein